MEKEAEKMTMIEKIDAYFRRSTCIDKKDIVFYNVLEEAFSIHGLIYENEQFKRMPTAIAETVSANVTYLSKNSAGGRVRFKTNSSYVAISAKMCELSKTPHMAITGSCGFDMYCDSGNGISYYGTFRPTFDVSDGYQSVLEFPDNKEREITINFPLFSNVISLHIGLQDSAWVDSPTPYKNKKPFVFYGNSVTQGGCVSRPGNAYSAILSRRLNVDFVNLAFSGSALGEAAIADYIAALDMDCFIMDYDLNSGFEGLEYTHKNMLKTVRKAHPDIPIIVMTAISMSRCINYKRSERRDIIYNNYLQLKNKGDQNIYFWDGSKEFALYEDYGTVEGVHMNDLGHWGVANSLEILLKKIGI